MASANTSSWSCQWRQYRRQAERVSFHSKCPNVGQRNSCAARLCVELDWAWTRIRIGDDGNEWSIGIAGTFQLRGLVVPELTMVSGGKASQLRFLRLVGRRLRCLCLLFFVPF